MLKKVLIGVVAVIVLAVLAGFLMPGKVQVERSVTIAKPPSAVFAHVCDFEVTQQWSPWAERDPKIVNEYTGTACEVDHKHTWKSDHPEVGNGAQWITAIEKHKKVQTKLDFGEQGQADAHFALAPEGEGTKVTWGFEFDAGMNPIARWMGVFISSAVGDDYEKGLAKLKSRVEGA